jgi:type I restriction enzyme S subunit
LKKCNSRLFPKNTVIITARGTVGKVIMPAIDMAMNQSCYALEGREGLSQIFLFLLTRESTDYFKKNTGGATFDTIVIDTFRTFKVIKPSKETIRLFSEIEKPIFETIENLLWKNANLRRTRDLLLPKLISGEIDVSELDIRIPEAEA